MVEKTYRPGMQTGGQRGALSGVWQVLLPLASAACTGPGASTGALQPQSVSGPCNVKKFFIARLDRTYTDMTVDSSEQACRFTLFNPDLQLVENCGLRDRAASPRPG